MNGENTNLTENINQKSQNKPQIDPFLVVSSYNEQFINQYKAFKLGQERFTELAKKEREILATEGINLVQSLQAKVMFLRARELAITYINRLEEVEAKLEFTKKVLQLAKDKKCKIVGSMLVIDEIISDDNNKNIAPISIDIEEINKLINNTDLNNLKNTNTKNVDSQNTASAKTDTTISDTEVKPAETEEKRIITKPVAEVNDDSKESKILIDDESKNSSSANVFETKKPTSNASTIISTKKKTEESGEGSFDEIASRILNSLNKEKDTNSENLESDTKACEQSSNTESSESKQTETGGEIEENSNSEVVNEDDSIIEKTKSIDPAELKVVKVYKCKDDCIDLLEPDNAELVYGLYSEELFNETFNKLLDVIYCYPLSITTLPDVAIDELKSNETTVCINGIDQTITTFEYIVRFCACVIMRNKDSANFKQIVHEFYAWCKKEGL